jgi:RNA polymerase sigma-70 factor (ECF subfamily)
MAKGHLGKVINHLRGLIRPHRDDAPTDAQLLQRFAASQEVEAFATLVCRHGGLVFGVCRRLLADEHDAEDAFQATFLVLARKAAAIRKPASMASWLYGVAHRIARKAKADAARRRAHEQEFVPMVPRDALAEVVWRELRPVLDEEINRLPGKYRDPIILCYLENKTNAEAARQLGWTKGTVSGRLARARELLRSRLVRRGLTLSGGLLASALAQNASAAVPAAQGISTIKAAALVAASPAAAAGLVSAPVAAMVEGVVKAMLISRVKSFLVVLLTLSFLGTGAALLARQVLVSGKLAVKDPVRKKPADKIKAERGQLQGTWRVISLEKDGDKAPDRELKLLKITFAGDKITYSGFNVEASTFKLDPSKTPAAIDLVPADGANKGQTVPAIYSLNNNELKLCIPDGPGKRPREFAAPAKSGLLLLVLERQLPGNKDKKGGTKEKDDPAQLKKENAQLRKELDEAKRELLRLRKLAEDRAARAEQAAADAQAQAADAAKARETAEEARRRAEKAQKENDKERKKLTDELKQAKESLEKAKNPPRDKK